LITLRPYQEKVTESILDRFKKGHRRILVYAAMRSGKTIIFCYIASKAKKTLVITDRKVLFNQTNKSLVAFGLSPEFITAGTKYIKPNNIYMSTSMALENRLKKQEYRDELKDCLIVIDEAHRQSFNYIFNDPLFKDTLIMGFTGSPIRQGSQIQLGEQYQSLVIGPTTKELEDMGYSVPLRVYDAPIADTEGIPKSSDGEFNNYETFQRFDNSKVYSGVVRNWLDICPNVCTIVYCVNIQHAVKTCEEFNNQGITAKFITSEPTKPKPPKEDSKKAEHTKYKIKKEAYDHYTSNLHHFGNIEDWKNGEYLVLVNVDMFTFGFDHPPLMCVILNRATNSTALLLQMGLRGATPNEGKEYSYLLDFGGNVDRLAEGQYNKTFDWTLFHKEKKKGDGVTSMKECPKCQSLVPVSAKVCDWCGDAFPKSKEEKFMELIEKTHVPLRTMTYRELELYAKQRGYNAQWVWHQIFNMHEEKGLKEYAKAKGYSNTWITRFKNNFR